MSAPPQQPLQSGSVFADSDEDNASMDTSDLKSGDIDLDDDTENDDEDDDNEDEEAIPVASIVASGSLSDDDAGDDDDEKEVDNAPDDAAKLSSKLSGLNVKKSRSYDHNRKPGSSPSNPFRRSNSSGGGSSKVKRSSPNKKEKDEWVAFDSPSSPSIKDRMRRSLQGKSHPDEEAF